MSHIFLSYSHKDASMVNKIARDLEKEGFAIWQDTKMNYGANWTNQIQKAIITADAVLVFISSSSTTSDWVRNEILASRKNRKFIIPVLIDKTPPPLILHDTLFIDLADSRYYDKGIKNIVASLSRITPKTLTSKSEAEKTEVVDEIAKKELAKEMANLMADEIAKILGIEKNTTISNNDKIDQNLVFVIISFENDMEPVFEGMKAAGASLGLNVKRVKDVVGDYRITNQIISMMNSARFIIADLTHERPNVYFELGYARGLGKTVITTARQGTTIHFDVKDWAYLEYTDSRVLEQKLKNRFEFELSKNKSL